MKTSKKRSIREGAVLGVFASEVGRAELARCAEPVSVHSGGISKDRELGRVAAQAIGAKQLDR